MEEELKKKEQELMKREAELLKYKKDLDDYKEKLIQDNTRMVEETKRMEAAHGLMMATNQQAVSTPVVQTVVKGTIGKMAEFVLDDDWKLWCERLEMYFLANDIQAEKKVSLFLTLLGKEAYALLRNLTTPQMPSQMSFQELIDVMGNHLQPARSVIAERYKFKECKQEEGEDVKSFVANLKKLSTFCEFGQNLETSIRDQFVWGVRSELIKKKLLSDKNLTYQKAIELALAQEAAMKNVVEMHTGGSSRAVNFVANKKPSKRNEVRAKACFCCGRPNHFSSNCKYRDYECHTCGKKGHLQNMCKSKAETEPCRLNNSNKGKQRTKRNDQNFIEEADDMREPFDHLFHLKGGDVDGDGEVEPISVEISVEKIKINFEVDTGSPISAISSNFYAKNKQLRAMKLRESHRIFKSYQGNIIQPRGILDVNVQYKNNKARLELFVIDGNSVPIIGRQWLSVLKVLNLSNTNAKFIKAILPSKLDTANIIKNFKTVFEDRLGKYTNGKFKLTLKEGAKPVYCKARPVPYALRDKIENELCRLEKNGIIKPVTTSEWATPIVPVLKSNGQIRICGDFKITLNPWLESNKHPIPRVTDLATKMSGATVFSSLDLAHAYQQVELDDASRELVTVNTHKGLFRFTRLTYGVSPAPGLFQNEIEKVLAGIDNVSPYFDDVFIYGKTQADHDVALYKVLKRFEECNLTVKLSKCQFSKSGIKFLGYEIDSKGLHVSSNKIDAIISMAKPTNQTELKSFLGMLNYYSKFIKNYASIVSPLYELLKKDVVWQWTTERDEAFVMAKKCVASCDILTHYRSDIPIKITCDASPRGLGAVLSHIFPSNDERPIAFASRVLTTAEKNYSQLDREALALVFGVKTFHQFVYGRKFLLETDHKPLIFIFGPKKGIPQMAASRVQRWAVFLLGYDFTIKHIRGSDNCSADSLSRLLKVNDVEKIKGNSFDDYNYLNFISDGVKTVDFKLVGFETLKDTELKEICEYVYNDWPHQVHNSLQAFKTRRHELYVENDCLMWGHRVVIPRVLRSDILKQLHSEHMGTVKMKALARSFFWWPGLDFEIEQITKKCISCLQNSENPRKATLHVWEWPEAPNARVHLDFCGPINGYMYLVITDAYSKWVDVREMTSITAECTIKILKEYFCVWGLPNIIVTDNGPTFTSECFKVFLEKNVVRHCRTAPYHPASNGAAENAVRTFKSKFKLLLKENATRHDALCRYLLAYRTTPHCTTGKSPAELQIGRMLRTRLSAVRPSVRGKVELSQSRQKHYFRGDRELNFNELDLVMIRNYTSSSNKWQKGQVLEKMSPVTYTVRTDDDKIHKRHIDQMKPRIETTDLSETNTVGEENVETKVFCSEEKLRRSETNDLTVNSCEHIPTNTSINVTKQPNATSSASEVSKIPQDANFPEPENIQLRRSTRIRKKPQKLNL